MATRHLTELVRAAVDAAVADGVLPADAAPPIRFERPKRREHGDWATNVALDAAGDPRAIAQALLERLPGSHLVASVEVAGPGFLNFRLSPEWLHDVVRRAAAPGFARTDEGAGQRMNVEYVSANPTGPVNVVSGRHAAVGDCIANLFEATGHEVTREFYVNDAGRQIRLFAESVAARYLQRFGVAAEVPEDGYRGEYVADLASDIAAEVGDRYVDADPDARVAALGGMALERVLDRMRSSLAAFGTRYDVWFRESSLRDSGRVENAVSRLTESGHTFERNGALWFSSSRFGDDKDRVVVRAGGEPTYLAPDVAYMVDKFDRGFDRLLYLLGPDHHGTVARFLALADALGYGRDRVEILLSGHVAITRGGDTVKSSKRAGEIITLDEVVAEVGADAARYTFQTRSIEAPLEFDLDLVTRQGPENPVYYVQYAHARICSILRNAADRGVDAATAHLDRLAHPSEDALMRKLASYEEVVPEAARARAPQKITRFAEELAAMFSAFYRDCRVLTDDAELSTARLALCLATKAVIADALGLLGVGAPERM
jgi:arginyl-tRNA synthetase